MLEIPKGWSELRSYASIRADDMIRAYNHDRFVRCDTLHSPIVGEHYMKNCVGKHWTVIRKRKKCILNFIE